jgi:hypothetical protein
MLLSSSIWSFLKWFNKIESRCDYFKTMFFGQFVESKLSEVTLKDTPLGPFKQLLRYLYTAKVRLACDFRWRQQL